MTDPEPSTITKDDVEKLQEIIEETQEGMMVDLLERDEHGGIAVGVSVAVDSLRNGDYEVAAASLRTTARLIEHQHINENADDEAS